MWRLLLIVSLVVLGFFSASRAGDDRSKAIETKRVALEDELRALLKDHGATHPAVVALEERIALLKGDAAQGEQEVPKGLLVVIAKQNVSTTLQDARLRSIGNRKFIVGVEVEGPKITKANFAGMVIWIPLDDVVQMVEVKKKLEGR